MDDAAKKRSLIHKFKAMAKKLKSNLLALYLAYRDPRVPLFAKAFTICVVAYAFSPIDLIPDLIPVLGYLDDLIIVPLGVYIALKLLPREVLEQCRARAVELRGRGKQKNWIAGALIIALWIALAVWGSWYVYRWLGR